VAPDAYDERLRLWGMQQYREEETRVRTSKRIFKIEPVRDDERGDWRLSIGSYTGKPSLVVFLLTNEEVLILERMLAFTADAIERR